jgi:hypothetical protein
MDSRLPFWEYVGAAELALEPSCREFGEVWMILLGFEKTMIKEERLENTRES